MLARFDLFPRLKPESRRTTSEGGFISLIGILLGLLLVINETVDFYHIHKVEHLELFDPENTPGVPQTITIHLEIEFFHLTCTMLDLGVSTETTTEDHPGSWQITKTNTQPTRGGEGCLLNAVIDVLKYESGEMHVALAPQNLADGFTVEEYFQYNASHVLKHLSFTGDGAARAAVLQTRRFLPKIVPEQGSTGRFLYDITVVPERRNLSPSSAARVGEEEDVVVPVEFSFQCREQDVITRNFDEGMFALQRLGLPGVFFTVKLSNLMIETNLVSPLWYSYMIHVLGICAGVPALVALVDSALHEALWKRKLD